MKRLFFAVVLACFCLAMSARTHTVAKGENLKSIAEKYDVTLAQLLEANPGVESLFFVGMKLTVPENTAATETVTQRHNEAAYTQQHITETTSSQDNTEIYDRISSETKIETEISAGLSLNNFVGKDADGFKNKLGFHVGLTARYYFYSDIFIEGSLYFATKGYKTEDSDTSGNYWDDEGVNYDMEVKETYKTYNIDFPIMLGYRFKVNDNLNFKIKAGPYLTYAISGERTVKGYYIEYPDIHSSEKETINTKTKIGKMKNYHPFGYGLTGGISINYKRTTLSFTYQRALSKTFHKDKSYEQNILISVGYCF